MFFIHKTNLLKKRDALFLRTLPTLVVFIAFAVVTLITWNTAKNSVSSEQNQVIIAKNQSVSSSIEQRMESYEDILRGAAGLFSASDTVNRQEWKDYLESYDIVDRYPGIQGVGYVEMLTPQDLENHKMQIRSEGFPNYTVFPAGERSLYSSIKFIEPFNDSNKKAFGYDMYSEPIRQRAMDKARDSKSAVVSGTVTLIQDEALDNPLPGFLMYLPVYKPGFPTNTIQQRQQNLQGYVYAPFRAKDLFGRTTTDNDRNYGFQIYSVESGLRQLIFESQYLNNIKEQKEKKLNNVELGLYDVTWEISGAVSRDTVSSEARERTNSILWGGLIISFLVAGFLYLLLSNRSKALAEKEERGIQDAKDELLALASHQLRTPATGVKQYVGMLREGFAGNLSAFQMSLLDKAYESNERQLATINEMLLVARSDAGQLKLEKEKFDVVELLRDIAEEQASIISGREQELTIDLPEEEIIMTGDKRYLRMAFENILSNATKYTKNKGKLRLSLTPKPWSVIFRVYDNGVGVPTEYHSMLFKKFSRVPNELTSQVVGSGIGLYLTKQIVESHGGAIEFDSKNNKPGSVVSIFLPRQDKQNKKRKTNL